LRSATSSSNASRRPGTPAGTFSFRLEHEGRRNLFGGDIVFHGGTILF
jgi:hypothetical protein